LRTRTDSLAVDAAAERLACLAAAAMLAALVLSACAPQPTRPIDQPPTTTPPSAEPTPEPRKAGIERGRVSHYGNEFAGRSTASGAPFDPEALTMAHRTLPFGTRVRVTNLKNQSSVEVVVNDRGPFVEGRIADVSLAAARVLGMLGDGVVDAIVEVVAPATR
jgi:rare lipoprotein A